MSANRTDSQPSAAAELSATPLRDGTAVVRWLDLVRIVLRNLSAQKFPFTLTLLTMAVGAFGLSATFFIGEGALINLWQDIDQLMGNRMIVDPNPGPGGALLEKRPSEAFTEEDLECVKRAVPNARYVVPVILFAEAHVTHGTVRKYMAVDGVVAVMEHEPMYRPVVGRGLSQRAHEGSVFECLLTVSAAQALEIDSARLPDIYVAANRSQVVGIIPDPPDMGPQSRLRAVVPYFWARRMMGKELIDLGSICVGWNSVEEMDTIIQGVRRALDECRGPDTYLLSSSQFRAQRGKKIVSNFMAFGTAQAIFCIFVAMIGVMNVMLASVVRRTREFAIRVAMGAEQNDLCAIVIMESGLLGMLGAIAGIAAAMLLSPEVCKLISERTTDASRLAPHFSMRGIVIPIVVCAGCGLVAGIIPALRVRRLDILASLRAE